MGTPLEAPRHLPNVRHEPSRCVPEVKRAQQDTRSRRIRVLDIRWPRKGRVGDDGLLNDKISVHQPLEHCRIEGPTRRVESSAQKHFANVLHDLRLSEHQQQHARTCRQSLEICSIIAEEIAQSSHMRLSEGAIHCSSSPESASNLRAATDNDNTRWILPLHR